MIRFSAGLVVVALGVLIGGVATSKLSLVYVSIAVSVLALIAWAIGVFLRRGELREELFGGRTELELVPAGAGVSAGLAAPGRSASATQSLAASPATPVPSAPLPSAPASSAGQDQPAYGQGGFSQGGFNAAAFAPRAQARPTWTPKETASKDPAPPSAKDRAVLPDPAVLPDSAVAPFSGWGSTSTPPFGTPPVAPRARDGAKESPAPPVAAGAGAPPAADAGSVADAGSAGGLRSWFDRPAQGKPPAGNAPAGPADGAPAAEPAETAATPAVTPAPGPSAVGQTPPAPAAKDEAQDTTSISDANADTSGDVDVAADEDDDWPTRYSWLDDEEADEAVESEDVPLESDDAVAAEVEASDLPTPTSPGASKSTEAKADADAEAGEAAAERADAEQAEAAETAASPAAHVPFEGTDAADVPPVLPSATDPGPDETAEAEAEAEPEPTAENDEPPAEVEPSAVKLESDPRLVTVVPGVPRYHEPDCILIRFMPEGDVQQKSIPEAKAAKCTPCVACQPED